MSRAEMPRWEKRLSGGAAGTARSSPVTGPRAIRTPEGRAGPVKMDSAYTPAYFHKSSYSVEQSERAEAGLRGSGPDSP